MAVSPSPDDIEDDGPTIFDPSEAAEEITDEDEPMHSDEEDPGDELMELEMVNDSSVYFDTHSDSIFHISQHPLFPGKIILTGGGDDVAYIWAVPSPEESGGVKPQEARLLQKLDGHEDSIVSGGFVKPDGKVVVTAGLDGRVRSWRQKPVLQAEVGKPPGANGWEFASEVQEVEEVNWVEMHPSKPLLALGAGDGSVWVYSVENHGELEILHVLYNHGGSCTAGAWTPEGGMLCTVSEDGSFYAYDLGLGGKAVVSITSADARFEVEGGLISIAVNWDSNAAAVGGAMGTCKVIGLPRSSTAPKPASRGGRDAAGGGQAGQLLATMQAHNQSVESLSFAKSLPLLASGSVDGSIVIYDTSRGYSIRKTIPLAHLNPQSQRQPPPPPPPPPPPQQQPQPSSATTSTTTTTAPQEEADNGENTVVKVEFIPSLHPPTSIILTSCGVDGTVKRWDARSGIELACFRGHGDGVLGFVQTERRIVTAGDDHVALVFDVEGQAAGGVGAVGGVVAAAWAGSR